MMSRLLENRVALVTAGVSGLGTAITRALAEHGASVGVHYRSKPEEAHALTQEITGAGGRAVAVQADLRDRGATVAMVESARNALGPLDILVNNASVYLPPQPVESVSWEDCQTEIEGSLLTALNATQAVLPGMLERGGGRLVFMIGTMLQRPAQGYSAHAVGKGALLAWVKTLAKELGPQGITAHCVSPGMALTPGVLTAIPNAEREALRRKTPGRRLATPEDVANLVVFLASDLAISADALHLNADAGLADLGGI